MNAPEILAAEVIAFIIALAVLGCLAVAREWVAVSVSIRTVPKAKRHRCAAVAAPVPALADAVVALPERGAA